MLTGERKREYAREWIRRRREEWFAGKSCHGCGSREGLQLHHRDPSQKVSHSVWSWSAPRRDLEVSKCDVLCSDCHLEITREQARKSMSGVNNPSSVLNDDIVRSIRNEYRPGDGVVLARKHGITKQVVNEIIHRIAWSHVA